MGIGFADSVEEFVEEVPAFVGPESLLKEQIEYLNAYIATNGHHTNAAKLSKVNRFYHWHWKEHDPAYIAVFTQLQAAISGIGVNSIEHRAVNGYKRELTFQGKRTEQTITEYDSSLQKAYLEAHDERYRSGGITVEIGPKQLAIVYPGSNALGKQGDSAPAPKQLTHDK
jgi:hypothetical protein